eukprot:403361188
MADLYGSFNDGGPSLLNKSQMFLQTDVSYVQIRIRNDIKEIRNLKQLAKIEFDFDSPRMRSAMINLGVSKDECKKKERQDFVKRGLDEDVIDLRFKHYQYSLIDTLNRMLEERRRIKMEMARDEIRHINNHQQQSPIRQQNNKSNNQTPNIFLSQGTIIGKSRKLNKDLSRSIMIESTSNPNLKQGNIFGSKRFAERRISNVITSSSSQQASPKQKISQNKLFGFTTQMNLNNTSLNAASTNISPKNMGSNSPNSTTIYKAFNNTQQSFFLTGLIDDDCFDYELQKQHSKNQKLANNSVLLKVKDQFNRKQKLEQISKRLQRAQEQIKLFVQQRQINGGNSILLNPKKRDEKIIKIKYDLIQKQNNQTYQEIERIKLRDEALAKRLKDIQQYQFQDLKQREIDYKNKREYFTKFCEEQEEIERQEVLSLLNSIEVKVQHGEEKYRQNIEEKVRVLTEKNDDTLSRRMKVNQKYQNEWDTQILNYTQKELDLQNRMKSLQRDINKVMNDQRQKRLELIDNQTSRKADEEENRFCKLESMMKKLERSENAVKEYVSEQRYALMLKQEERKLKEEDMQKARERMKRLEFKKKMEIIEKEMSQEKIIRFIKDREKDLKLKKYENSVKTIIEKAQLRQQMQKWAHSGFSDIFLTSPINSQNKNQAIRMPAIKATSSMQNSPRNSQCIN